MQEVPRTSGQWSSDPADADRDTGLHGQQGGGDSVEGRPRQADPVLEVSEVWMEQDTMREDIEIGIVVTAIFALGLLVGLAFRWPSGL